MELTILLAQVFGVYLIVGGIAVWSRRRYFAPVLGNFLHDPITRLVVGTVELLAGLFLVFTHNIWSSAAASIVSLFGWMLLLEGAFYMLASDSMVDDLIAKLNRPWWYTFGGIICLVLGAYLLAFGFGVLN